MLGHGRPMKKLLRSITWGYFGRDFRMVPRFHGENSTFSWVPVKELPIQFETSALFKFIQSNSGASPGGGGARFSSMISSD
mmetsp:Transcript_49902/g.104130  ORF Transcript_49902/g.104130 Transcript_49902/m.104130 type:complete len:81 (-) Transcript_49902:199-441(-)